MTLPALRVNDVVPFGVLGQELGDDFGGILQVAVHHHDHVAADMVQRGSDRDLVAEIPRQADGHDARILGRGGCQHFDGAVAAAVIDQHDFVRSARDLVEHGAHSGQQRRQHFALVIDRDG